jgi:hypothetical protein
MSEVCLFCNEPEKSYKPECDYVCGLCVILLADADQADLKKSCKKALNEGYLRKASALELFIIPEGKDGIKPVRRNYDRKRTTRPIRNKKSDARQSKTKQTVSVL